MGKKCSSIWSVPASTRCSTISSFIRYTFSNLLIIEAQLEFLAATLVNAKDNQSISFIFWFSVFLLATAQTERLQQNSQFIWWIYEATQLDGFIQLYRCTLSFFSLSMAENVACAFTVRRLWEMFFQSRASIFVDDSSIQLNSNQAFRVCPIANNHSTCQTINNIIDVTIAAISRTTGTACAHTHTSWMNGPMCDK